MLAPVLSLSLALVSFETNANIGIRGENRTGQRPIAVGTEDVPVTEFEVVPALGLTMAFKSSALSLSYSPRLYTLVDFTGRVAEVSENADLSSGRPLLLHQFGANYSYTISPRVSLGASLIGSIGEVDYSGVNLVQGTGQVVPGTGEEGGEVPAASAAGRVPGGETVFSNQNYGGSLNLGWHVAKNHQISFSGGANYNGPLGDEQIFPEQLSGTGGVAWAWRMHPNYNLGVTASYGESHVDRGTIGTGKFRSINLSASLGAQTTRVFNFGVSGGVLLAFNEPALAANEEPVQDGLSAIPTGNASFTFIPTSGRGNYDLSTSLGIGVAGFVDPLQAQGFAPRLAFSWNLSFRFFEDWAFTPSATLFTPASLDPPDTTDPNTIDSLNETLISINLPLAYQIIDELNVAGGLSLASRGTHLLADDVSFPDWFVLGFLSFTANTTTKL